MTFDDACRVWHAAATEFDVKFVAYFVQAVDQGKVLADETEELFANICFNFHVLSGIEPGDVSFLYS